MKPNRREPNSGNSPDESRKLNGHNQIRTGGHMSEQRQHSEHVEALRQQVEALQRQVERLSGRVTDLTGYSGTYGGGSGGGWR